MFWITFLGLIPKMEDFSLNYEWLKVCFTISKLSIDRNWIFYKYWNISFSPRSILSFMLNNRSRCDKLLKTSFLYYYSIPRIYMVFQKCYSRKILTWIFHTTFFLEAVTQRGYWSCFLSLSCSIFCFSICHMMLLTSNVDTGNIWGISEQDSSDVSLVTRRELRTKCLDLENNIKLLLKNLQE